MRSTLPEEMEGCAAKCREALIGASLSLHEGDHAGVRDCNAHAAKWFGLGFELFKAEWGSGKVSVSRAMGFRMLLGGSKILLYGEFVLTFWAVVLVMTSWEARAFDLCRQVDWAARRLGKSTLILSAYCLEELEWLAGALRLHAK